LWRLAVCVHQLGFQAPPKLIRKENRKMANVEAVGEIYECELCGNVVEVKEVGGGELVCCGEPMILVNKEEK